MSGCPMRATMRGGVDTSVRYYKNSEGKGKENTSQGRATCL